MSYMTAASLNLTDSFPRKLSFGELEISAEINSIPKLNSEQQKIGFGGLKYEDLNKSPVFGKAKIKMGFYYDSILEFSYTPSLEIKGAKPKDLYGFSLSKELPNLIFLLESPGKNTALNKFLFVFFFDKYLAQAPSNLL